MDWPVVKTACRSEDPRPIFLVEASIVGGTGIGGKENVISRSPVGGGLPVFPVPCLPNQANKRLLENLALKGHLTQT